MDDFGLWDVFISIFWFMLLFAWISLLFRIIADIFRDDTHLRVPRRPGGPLSSTRLAG